MKRNGLFRKGDGQGALLLSILLSLSAMAHAGEPSRCLLLYSYHQGYAWNDGVDQGATSVLEGVCEIKRFFMDSKRNPDERYIRDKAEEALTLINRWQPDVIMAADDNVSRYLVMPHLKSGTIPVVFCGINVTAEPYGFPLGNMTGMVEVSPLAPLMVQATAALRSKAERHEMDTVVMTVIDADRYTARKQFKHIHQEFSDQHMVVRPRFVQTFDEWKERFLEAQQGDIVFLLNNSGIADWDDEEARRFVMQHTRKLSITIHGWMRHLTVLTMSKVPQEQGEWAAEAMKRILQGEEPGQISMVTNRRWKSYIQSELLALSGVTLSDAILQRSEVVE